MNNEMNEKLNDLRASLDKLADEIIVALAIVNGALNVIDDAKQANKFKTGQCALTKRKVSLYSEPSEFQDCYFMHFVPFNTNVLIIAVQGTEAFIEVSINNFKDRGWIDDVDDLELIEEERNEQRYER